MTQKPYTNGWSRLKAGKKQKTIRRFNPLLKASCNRSSSVAMKGDNIVA